MLKIVSGGDRLFSQYISIHMRLLLCKSCFRDGMQIAARNGSIDMLTILADMGGSMQSKGPNGDSLLHLSTLNGHLFCIQWLISQGISTRVLDGRGQNIVHIAARRCEVKILEYLLEHHPEIDFLSKDYIGATPYDCIPRTSADTSEKTRDYFKKRVFPNRLVKPTRASNRLPMLGSPTVNAVLLQSHHLSSSC